MGLMDAKCSYSDLERKYSRFRVPAAKVKIEGKELTGVGINQIQATLSLDGASAVSFRISDAYELKKSSFDSSVKSKLKLGSKLTLELGYGSSLTKIFTGYISEVGADFSEAPALTVTAMDVRRLMMEGTCREETHVVTAYSAAFKEVMDRYKALCSKTQIEATPNKEITQIVQRDSDYDFVTQVLTRRGNREFFVLDDTAYFREPGKAKSPIMTLQWGDGLKEFRRSANYENLKITVLGFNDEKKEAVKAQITEKTSNPQKAVGSPHEVIVADPDAMEAKKAKTRAEQEAWQRKMRAESGSALCIGLPELVPGRYVAMKGLDKDFDVKYYIREVRHEINEDSFLTMLTIGGWEK